MNKIFINNSGGAQGADTIWETEGEKYNVSTKAFSFAGHKSSSRNLIILTDEELKEADEHVIEANKTLKRFFPIHKPWIANLLRRNWYQVKNSTTILAISTFDNKGQVKGGTAWATQMAIDNFKDVYVFDQENNKWFEWDYDQKKYIEYKKIPKLSKNFAGIGTRDINQTGILAIQQIYNFTFTLMNIIASVTLKYTADGGRDGGISHKYRPNLLLENGEQSDCYFDEIKGKEMLYPGETNDVEIYVSHPEIWSGKLNDKFDIREGQKVIGTGVIKIIKLNT
jgi:hypothetical protein